MWRVGDRIDERKAAGGKRGPARTEVSREPYFAAFNQVDRVVLKVQLAEEPVRAGERAATLRKHQDAIIAVSSTNMSVPAKAPAAVHSPERR